MEEDKRTQLRDLVRAAVSCNRGDTIHEVYEEVLDEIAALFQPEETNDAH